MKKKKKVVEGTVITMKTVDGTYTALRNDSGTDISEPEYSLSRFDGKKVRVTIEEI